MCSSLRKDIIGGAMEKTYNCRACNDERETPLRGCYVSNPLGVQPTFCPFMEDTVAAWVEAAPQDSVEGANLHRFAHADARRLRSEVLKEASILAGKGSGRSAKEDKRYAELKSEISEMIPLGGLTLAEREVQKEKYKIMKKDVKDLEQRLFGDKK